MTSDALRRWHEATCGGVGWPLTELWVAYGLEADEGQPRRGRRPFPIHVACARHPKYELGGALWTPVGVLVALWDGPDGEHLPGPTRAEREREMVRRFGITTEQAKDPAELTLTLFDDGSVVDRWPEERDPGAWCRRCGRLGVDEGDLGAWLDRNGKRSGRTYRIHR